AAAVVVVGEAVLDLLQRYLAAQLLVQGHEHLAQPAPGVRSQPRQGWFFRPGLPRRFRGFALVVVCGTRAKRCRSGKAKPGSTSPPVSVSFSARVTHSSGET